MGDVFLRHSVLAYVRKHANNVLNLVVVKFDTVVSAVLELKPMSVGIYNIFTLVTYVFCADEVNVACCRCILTHLVSLYRASSPKAITRCTLHCSTGKVR